MDTAHAVGYIADDRGSTTVATVPSTSALDATAKGEPVANATAPTLAQAASAHCSHVASADRADDDRAMRAPQPSATNVIATAPRASRSSAGAESAIAIVGNAATHSATMA